MIRTCVVSRYFLAVALVSFSVAASLQAQTFLGGIWENASSWDGGAVPANNGTADVVFSSPTGTIYNKSSAILPQDWNLHSLTWNASGVSQGQGSLNIPGPSPTTLTLQAGFTNDSGGTVTIYPNVALGAMQVWSDTTTNSTAYYPPYTSFSGQISGSGGIMKMGGGRIALTNTNSYTGGTVIQQGVLSVSTPAALGTGDVTLDGGVLAVGAANETMAQNVKMGANGGVIESFSGQFAGTVTGSGPLTFRNGNALGATLSGVNSYTGGTTISQYSVHVTGNSSLGMGSISLQNGGVLALEKSSNLRMGQEVTMQTGAVIALQDASLDPKSVISSASTGGFLALVGANYTRALDLAQIGNGGLFLGSADNVVYSASTLGVGAGNVYRLGGGTTLLNASPALTLTATNVLTGNRSLLVGGGTSGVTNSAAAGNTVVTLSGANDFTGGTTISARLVVGDDHSLGSGPLTFIAGGLSSTKTSALISNAITATVMNNRQFQLASGGTGSLTLSGAVDLAGGVSEFIGGSVTFSGVISNGGLRLNSGNWTLSGNNTFSGGLTSYGTLNFSSTANLGSNSNAVTLGSGTLKALGSVTVAQPITISNFGAAIDTNGFNLTLTNQLSGGTLTKLGAGNLMVKTPLGASVSVQAGALVMDDNGAQSGGSVTIGSGAFLEGSGSVGFVISRTGATVSPGFNGVGTLTLNSNFEIGGGSILDFGLGALLSDLIVVKKTFEKWSGALNGKITINISDTGGLQAGSSYSLITWQGGSIANLQTSDFQLGSSALPGSFSIANSSLIFMAAPEPSTSVMLGSGLLCLVLRQRRRL